MDKKLGPMPGPNGSRAGVETFHPSSEMENLFLREENDFPGQGTSLSQD